MDSIDYCPKCGLKTNHEILSEEISKGGGDYEPSWSHKYSIIKCKGCNNIQFKSSYGDEFMEKLNQVGELVYYRNDSYYPSFLENYREKLENYSIPKNIENIHLETLEAIKSNSLLLAAAGLRMIVEAISKENNIKRENLEKKIITLLNEGKITEKEAERLQVIRLLGNESVHKMTRSTKENILLALDIVEHLIINLYGLSSENLKP
ncbi:DUF4145 domain-containing protein [Myroides marinus]|uniref:DUF4145 domain-containing protein n=1 Tax=Myroides marinus TaxID=703342 RepID=UPI00257494E8|nr:DUF4145 domain-containing protein [Myroides marinus]MDM1352211.1 DUF4145 domain-containing protein [Myroides marinus]MDM1359403.1 DUF4145 domain-containing protein [Myroides marinus]